MPSLIGWEWMDKWMLPIRCALYPSMLRAAGVGRALRSAAKEAQKIARMHNTPLYYWENGKVDSSKGSSAMPHRAPMQDRSEDRLEWAFESASLR
jgi:hypothetical protein